MPGTLFTHMLWYNMVVMMVMVKMVKIENGKKEKYSIIYNIYIYLYYSVKMALPKIDFDQNDHDHFDHF